MLGLFSGELIFGRAYYWTEFCVSKWVELDNKRASTNSPWAYIWEGLLPEGFLRLRFGGLIFGRTYFFWGGGGGAYQSKWLCTWKITVKYNAQSCLILKFEKAAKKQSQGASHPW